jgi:hypothetical protein
MTRKSVLYALAVVVLTGSMAVVGSVAVAASAGDQGMNLYARADSAYWPESDHQFGPVEGSQAEGTEIREPMETGAVPEKSMSSSDLSSTASGDARTEEFGGRKYLPGEAGF